MSKQNVLLTEKSNWYGIKVFISCVVPYLAVPILFVTLNTHSLGLSAWAMIGMYVYCGASFNRVQFFIHDLSHNSLFTTNKLNKFAGNAVGPLIGVYFKNYQRFHMLHHKAVGSAEDPQLDDYFNDKTKTLASKIHFLIQPLYGYKLFKYLRREMGPVFAKETTLLKKPTVGFWMLFVAWQCLVCLPGALTAPNLLAAALQLVLPVASGTTLGMFFTRLRSVAEHQSPHTPGFEETKGHKFNWLEGAFLYGANFNFHNIHHDFPHISSRHYSELAASGDHETSNQSMLRSITDQLMNRS